MLMGERSLADGILQRIFSEAGLAGAFIVLLLLAVWKLYKDLQRANASKYTELKALKDATEEKYKGAMKEVNETIREFDKLLDRMFDYLTLRRP